MDLAESNFPGKRNIQIQPQSLSYADLGWFQKLNAGYRVLIKKEDSSEIKTLMIIKAVVCLGFVRYLYFFPDH